ncbi:phage portal protein [Solibacillus sp. MA9]|uniref:Phage portal protein n=1 Tax=Solibacillus palustris TaxID=2908203 RepID=A0ABS9UBR4_9BACL|nr:phage portal protein [Solibacillus sp. MA9]MCH7321785.1 phage portal protein [Solibacillus sp. MA9]
MTNLSAFLAQNAIKPDSQERVVSKRFVDPETKEPMKWQIVAVDSDRDEALRKQNTKRLPVPGKKNVFQPTTDYDAYLATLAVECTVFPNLHDVDLQNSYKVMGAEALLKKMLLPGEYAEYLKVVQNANGFDVGMDEAVEEAKN